MDTEKMRIIYTCFIAGGFVVPVLDVLIGAIGSALDLGADAGFHADADMGMDINADASGEADLSPSDAGGEIPPTTGSGHSHTPIIVNLLTLSLTAVVFGAVGRLCLLKMPLPAGVFVAAVSGLLSGWLLGRFVILPLRRNRADAYSIKDTVGQVATVTLELRDDFTGTVTLKSATGSIVSYDARPIVGISRIPIQTLVSVVEVDEVKAVCIVAPLENRKES